MLEPELKIIRRNKYANKVPTSDRVIYMYKNGEYKWHVLEPCQSHANAFYSALISSRVVRFTSTNLEVYWRVHS